MRFKLIGNEVSRKVKSGPFGMFTKTETDQEFTILPSQKALDFVKSQKKAYSAAFGSFDLFRIAKGIASDTESRFSVVGFFLNKSGETYDSAIFVKTHNLSEISALWDELVADEMTSDYRMMRSVVIKDNLTGERIVINAFFDAEIEFKDSAEDSTIEAFNKVLLDIMVVASANHDFGAEMDRLFEKALLKSREKNAA